MKNENDMKQKEDKKRYKEPWAMDFLMTYGWSLLVVIAAVASLAYFGVLPKSLIPEERVMPNITYTTYTDTQRDLVNVHLIPGAGYTIEELRQMGRCDRLLYKDTVAEIEGEEVHITLENDDVVKNVGNNTAVLIFICEKDFNMTVEAEDGNQG